MRRSQLFALSAFISIAFSFSVSFAGGIPSTPFQIYGYGDVTCAVPSPDGEHIAIAGGMSVKIINAATGAQTALIYGNTEAIDCLAWSPDGTKILTGSRDNTIRLWDALYGTLLHAFSSHTKPITCLTISKDGSEFLSGSADGTVKLWGIDGTLKQTYIYSIYNPYPVTGVAFGSDPNEIYSSNSGSSYDGYVHVFNKTTGVFIRELFYFRYEIFNMQAVSPDKHWLAAGSDHGNVWIYNLQTNTLATTQSTTGNPAIKSLSFSSDGSKLAVGYSNTTAQILDRATLKQLRTIKNTSTGALFTPAFSKNDTRLVAAIGDYGYRESGARVWDAITTAPALKSFVSKPVAPAFAAYSADGQRILTANGLNQAVILNAATGAELTTFSGHSSGVIAGVYSFDNKTILTGSNDKTARLWNAATGAALTTLTGHTAEVLSVALSPDGNRALTGSADGTARLWNAKTGAFITTLTGHTSFVTGVAFSPDNLKIATASLDKTIRIWDNATSPALSLAIGPSPELFVTSMVFAPDSQHVLTGQLNGDIALWDIATGEQTRAFTGHTDQVLALSFLGDGSYFVSGARDGSVRVWNAVTGANYVAFNGGFGSATAAAFAPDKSKLLAGTEDGTLWLWYSGLTPIPRPKNGLKGYWVEYP